jgi:hypothetical protein
VSEVAPEAVVLAPGLRSHQVLALTRRRRRALHVELLACGIALGLLAALMSATHVSRGGLYYDDWSLIALGRFPGPGGLLHSLWLYYGQRPGQLLYYAALQGAFGGGAEPRLALAAAMVALQGTCLYALLRCLSVRVRDASAIAALSLAFPYSDSLWLWGVLSLTSLAISAGLLGVTLALRALQSSGRRSLALHTASLSLYVVSILSYEAFAVAGCLAGLLYAHVVGLRRARLRWLLDVVVIALTLGLARLALPIDVATPSHVQSLTGMLDHAGLIVAHGARVLGAAALPLGGVDPWIGTALVGAVLATAALLGLRSRHGEAVPGEAPSGMGVPWEALSGEGVPGEALSGERAGGELGGWLAIAGAGALASLAAWAVYVPATNHYAPSLAGTVNRMNAGAGLGIAVILYACIVLAARVLARIARVREPAVSLVIGAVSLALLGAYLSRVAADARSWDTAAGDQRAILADLHSALPRPPAGATVYAFDAPLTVGPGVPVLNTMLDLTSALRLSYSSPTLLGVPLAGHASLSCTASGPVAGGVVGAYGRSYLVDAGRRRAFPLGDRAGCAVQARLATSGAGRRRIV